MVIGDPMHPSTQIGAMISNAHMQGVLRHIEKAKQQGATVLAGGRQAFPEGLEGGSFIEPTILGDCTDEMACVREEIFGPVMSVLTFHDEQEAVRRANDTPYGLGAGIMTKDVSRAHRLADALQAGNIWVNSYNLIPPGLPFGGSKQSGFGREGSVYALEAYTEVKAVYIQL